MKIITFITLFYYCIINCLAKEQLIVTDEKIQHLNSLNLPWKAGKNIRFEGLTIEQIKKMLGVKKNLISEKIAPKGNKKNLPTSFDSRIR
jgi:hypothetical protein